MSEYKRQSVFNPFEQRVFGLVKIAEGIVTVIVGTKRAPSWELDMARWGARRAGRRALSREQT